MVSAPSPLYRRIYSVAAQIPAGRVASYGQIARIAGCGARVVGYAMAALPAGGDIPWHRVINSRGMISPRADGDTARQRRLLEAEGLRFDRAGRLDLAAVGWAGPAWDWLEANGMAP
ncbi:MAG: cysteine methyltransferase [Inquilinus sp.]|nr:cysteine methyltransferase [Inquilinus sp.]